MADQSRLVNPITTGVLVGGSSGYPDGPQTDPNQGDRFPKGHSFTMIAILTGRFPRARVWEHPPIRRCLETFAKKRAHQIKSRTARMGFSSDSAAPCYAALCCQFRLVSLGKLRILMAPSNQPDKLVPHLRISDRAFQTDILERLSRTS